MPFNFIITFFIDIVSKIVNILNQRFFSDMPITYLQLILGCLILKFVFKFIFGGFKEVDTETRGFIRGVSSNVKYTNNKVKERERKKDIIRRKGDK